ncbi:MAG: hypothetical protein NTZ16_13355, partial [Verrucomicrobia bacterium]|nr:hypothetical protein [Verrucomicrobiota bacterium]
RIGAEGLPVKHGENILLADAPADFAAQIAALFAAPATAARIGAAGRELVRAKFGWETVNGIFEGYCRQACELGKRRNKLV